MIDQMNIRFFLGIFLKNILFGILLYLTGEFLLTKNVNHDNLDLT